MLSEQAYTALKNLAEQSGCSRSAVIEQLLLSATDQLSERFLSAFEQRYGKTLTAIMLSTRKSEKLIQVSLEMQNAEALHLPEGFFSTEDVKSDLYAASLSAVETRLAQERQKRISKETKGT